MSTGVLPTYSFFPAMPQQPNKPTKAFPAKPFLVENLGIAVRQLREKQGWSQEELAERSGLNRSYVGEVERGKVVASVVTAQKIAAALSVTVVDLFTQCETIERLRARPAQPGVTNGLDRKGGDGHPR